MHEKKPIPSHTRSIFRRYWRAVRRYPWLLAPLLLGTIGLQAADLIAPLYLRRFFNLLATQKSDASTVGQLFGILVIIALVWFVSWVCRRAQNLTNFRMEARVMTDLTSTAFEYLIGHSYDFFISHFAGSLTHRVNRFSRAFETMLDAVILQFFPTLLYVIGAVIILFLRNHTIGIALGIWAALLTAFQIFAARLRQPLRVARAEADSAVTGALADSISNHMTTVLFSGVSHEHGLLKEVVERWRKATLRSWNADELIWGILGFSMIAINAGLLYGAVEFWQRGLLTVGDFILMQAYLFGTFDRLISINRELRRFHDAFADANEMVDMLDMPHGIRDRAGAAPLTVRTGEIVFKDINFYFRSGRPVLERFNLTIRPSEKVALVGPSGAGKSTVVKLLLRLYDIPKGTIEIDGGDIAYATQESVRNAVAFVPQEPILFHRSLMENIRYGRRDASDDEVVAAAKQAHCHEFIADLPERYETYVGERGVKLSGGERQRVAIARAILKNAPILVLDEATSSLDSESEALIQDALTTFMAGKTVIVIAHRLSTIMKMDRIVVLENGQIVSEGTHRELIECGGLYQKLWSIQAGSFIE
ncbi:MAG: ABC transporter ATP-binding protein [Candidatus Sungbacteria bacterium]|nr:ABC transporter ATP-binding protein [Candidatus Sungbacteria bacterium]